MTVFRRKSEKLIRAHLNLKLPRNILTNKLINVLKCVCGGGREKGRWVDETERYVF